MSIIKSEGTTHSERVLARLCDRSFLGLWSYPNVYRDQARSDTNRVGKELCDLLVVCGQDVVIFSDKRSVYAADSEPYAWRRWYKRTIKEGAKQVWGAERWLRSFPGKVFLDKECTVPVPNLIEAMREARVHRVIVASGAVEASRASTGRSGSLKLVPSVHGIAHDDEPFTVGSIDPEKGFIHVLDEITLQIVLMELDTISDFVQYLQKKEGWIERGELAFADGEENLLAIYLSRVGPDDKHDIIMPHGYHEFGAVHGKWERYSSSDDYHRKKAADAQSYLWDYIIQDFAHHALAGTLYEGSSLLLGDNERLVRILARESRHDRRVLSAALIDRARDAKEGKFAVRTVMSDASSQTAYVFVVTTLSSADYEQYRLERRHYLSAYCKVLALKFPSLKQIVGIATDAPAKESYSVDLCLELPCEWSEHDFAIARTLRSEMRMLRDENLTSARIHSDEYPARAAVEFGISYGTNARQPKSKRNSLCPCKSGLKYKKCCGRR